MDYIEVSAEEFDRLEGVAEWRVVRGTIRADFRTGSYPAAAALVGAITERAEEADHHPDIDIRYPGRVRVVLTTHATGGLTTLDVELARQISQAAADAGAAGDAAGTQAVEIAIDTMDADHVRPFWAAVLGYEDREGHLVDPLRQGPALWFQQLDEPGEGRGHIRLDIEVPHDVVDQRIAAALAAGGTLVTDRDAKGWWVLADAEGQEARIGTGKDSPES